MTIVFLKLLPKNTKIRYFWSQIQPFSLFQDILQCDKFKFADFKYDNSFSKKFQPKNIIIRHCWSHIQAFSFFHKILELDKFEGADFKTAILVSNSRPKILKSGIFGPKFRHFCSFTKINNQTNSKVLLSNVTIVFEISNPQIPK